MPGIMGKVLAALGDKCISDIAAEAGLIGEEAQEGIAEELLQVYIMSLVYFVHEDLHGFRRQHITVVLAEIIQSRAGLDHKYDPPHTLRQGEKHHAVRQSLSDILYLGIVFRRGHMAAGQHSDDLVLL